MIWILLVLFYGLCKGGREIVKKKAMTKSSVMEVLLFYTLISFIMVLPEIPEAGGLEGKYFFYIAIKSLLIFIAWICSFKALKAMPVSLYGVLDLSRVLFATLLGVIVLNESLGIFQIVGLLLVCFGLFSLKCKIPFIARLLEGNIDKSKKAVNNEVPVSVWVVLAAFTSCLLNAVSGTMDKILMKDITSSQLQFWYMLFLLLYYIVYFVVSKTKLRLSTFKNGWIWILALLFVLADKALFEANRFEESRVTVMTILKQSGCLVTIVGGKLVFKEKNVGYKFFCCAIILIGIVVAVLGENF